MYFIRLAPGAFSSTLILLFFESEATTLAEMSFK